MKQSRVKGFSELPGGGVHSAVKRLSEKSQSPNLGLLFYKLLSFWFVVDELENGIKSQHSAERLAQILGNINNYNVRLPAIPHQKSFEMKTAYRLAVGMGYPSLLENGFLFHHTYGIPYIDGATLKGLARHVLLLSIYESVRDRIKGEEPLSELEEFLLLKEEDFRKHALFRELEGREVEVVLSEPTVRLKNPHLTFRKIFGTQEKRGEVIFHEAYPKNFTPDHLELDIMNPHYAEYYQNKGQKPPGDWDNPVPIKFLTLKKGIVFRFYLSYEPLGREEPELLEYAELLLRIGLMNFGVGGKKAKGYGWFEP